MVNLVLARAYRARNAYSAVMAPSRCAVAMGRATTGYPGVRPPEPGVLNTPSRPPRQVSDPESVPPPRPPRQFSAPESVPDLARDPASVAADVKNASTNRGVCAQDTRRTSPS